MKIRAMSLAGFGPFRAQQDIDFSVYDREGIFLISGRTGAGKSSILDGICFALYGSVPRYQETSQRLRSDHALPDEPTFVTLEFELHDKRYRIRRVPEYERLAKRGDKLVTQKHEASLAVYDGQQWQGLAARPVEVAQHIHALLQLNKEQFLQVILLAQNRFQDFLLAKNDDRQKVLQSLFNTHRFAQVEKYFSTLRKELADRVESDEQRLQQLANLVLQLGDSDDENSADGIAERVPADVNERWFTEQSEHLDRELQELRPRLEQVRQEHEEAQKRVTELSDLARRQKRYAQATVQLAQLQEEQEHIRTVQNDLDVAERALRIQPSWVGLKQRREQHSRVTEQRQHCYDRVLELSSVPHVYGVQLPDTPDHAAQSFDHLQIRLAKAQELVSRERELHGIELELVTTEKRRIALTDRERDIAQDVQKLPEERVRIERDLQEERETALQVEYLGEQLTTAGTRLQAARRVTELDATLKRLHEQLLTASQQQRETAQQVDALIQARFANMGSELAQNLQPGEPCPVCGATEHPAPAVAHESQVSTDDISAAQTELDSARARLQELQSQIQSVELERTQAQTQSQGHSVADIEIEETTLQRKLDSAQAARDRVKTLEDQLVELDKQHTEHQQELEQIRVEANDVRVLVGQLRSRIESLNEMLDLGQDNDESLTDVVEKLQHYVTVFGEYLELDRASRETASELETAEQQFTALLAEHGFTAETDYTAVQASNDQITQLQAQIQAFNDAMARVQGTLSEPELQALPQEPAQLDRAQEHLVDVRTRLEAIQEDHAQLSERCKQIATLVQQATTLLGSSQQRMQEYQRVQVLAQSLNGVEPNTKRMRLETYVLAAQLEQIIAAANVRLENMTAGRYQLRHDDSKQYRNTQSGLGVQVLDTYSQQLRPTHSLSGGETFLASLALALGLAEVVSNQAGGIKLDTLFIDEGFGSLDDETLNVAMNTLDSLRHAGRCIGLISHVGAMKEQIPSQLQVIVTVGGDSKIQQAQVMAS